MQAGRSGNPEYCEVFFLLEGMPYTEVVIWRCPRQHCLQTENYTRNQISVWFLEAYADER
jgi:hypothetical protein